MRRDTHDVTLASRMGEIKRDLFGHSEAYPVILHRRDMVQGKPPFDILKSNERVRFEFATRWASLVREVPYLTFATAIDKHAHVEKYKVWQYDPYHFCLETILQRYVYWLNSHGHYGDVLVEARAPKPDRRLKEAYKRFYLKGLERLSTSVIQARLTTNELKFATKSEDVAGHQLADSLAHPTLRYMQAKYDGAPLAESYGQQLVGILVQKKFARNPRTLEIDGWGMKWLPRKTGA